MESNNAIQNKLSELAKCPACEKGMIIHVADHYYCDQGKDNCGFMVRSDQYGVKMTKTMLKTLIANRFLEPLIPGLRVFPGKDPVNGFIVLTEENKVGFLYPNKFPVAKCPKCKEKNIIMKFSEQYNSLFYGCEDYKNCKLTFPFLFRKQKPLYRKDIEKLITGSELQKELVSKKNQKYTVSLYLDDDMNIATSLG